MKLYDTRHIIFGLIHWGNIFTSQECSICYYGDIRTLVQTIFSTIVNGVIPNQHGSPIAQEEGKQMKYKYSTFTVS